MLRLVNELKIDGYHIESNPDEYNILVIKLQSRC